MIFYLEGGGHYALTNPSLFLGPASQAYFFIEDSNIENLVYIYKGRHNQTREKKRQPGVCMILIWGGGIMGMRGITKIYKLIIKFLKIERIDFETALWTTISHSF